MIIGTIIDEGESNVNATITMQCEYQFFVNINLTCSVCCYTNYRY